MNRFKQEPPKFYLNPREVEVFRQHALATGHTEEWYQKWLDDYVVVIEPLEEVQVNE
jgi:hypothetical protein